MNNYSLMQSFTCQRGHQSPNKNTITNNYNNNTESMNKTINTNNVSRHSYKTTNNNSNYKHNKHLDEHSSMIIHSDDGEPNTNNNNMNSSSSKRAVSLTNNCNKTNSNYKNNLNNNLCNNINTKTNITRMHTTTSSFFSKCNQSSILCFCQICSCFINLCLYINNKLTFNNANTINDNHIIDETNNKNNNNNNNVCKSSGNNNKIIETSRFYRFLARFSGRRRSLQHNLSRLTSTLVCILIVISLCNVTEACSARTTPKPRPPPTPTPRPNITFHTYKCPATYAEWYCLNDATCFSVKIGDEILYNCWCAEGFMGPRCEYKEIDGSFLPTRPRIMMETASIASGATLALIVVFILCVVLYIRYQQNQKQNQLADPEHHSNGQTNGIGIDTVDGFPHTATIQQQYQALRPFGSHHAIPIPMAATLKR